MRDAVGQRGEAIFYVLMTEFHGSAGPIFRPQFLGDKWPSVDYIVELQSAGPTTPFFFVQVRSTREGYTLRERRLKIKLTREQVRGLASYPAPTYIVGIDEVNEQGYLVSANGESIGSLSSLHTGFAINAANRTRLWSEVNAYWSTPSTPKLVSSFVDPSWR